MEKPIIEPLRLRRPKKRHIQDSTKIRSNTHNSLIWELLEMDAPTSFFIDDAETPAFLLFPRHHTFSIKPGYNLYMSYVGLINNFTSEKKALARLKEIVEHANWPLKLYRIKKHGRDRGKRTLFAENTIERIDRSKLMAPMKAFNIDEWKQLAP